MVFNLLDVGETKYGDCIVVRQGNRSILIDAAHPGDTELLKTQFRRIFGHSGPYRFDLLVVTHCHLDHIGCLPELVRTGVVRFTQALVADERLGWGRDDDDDSPVDSLPPAVRRLALALQEEPLVVATDEEICLQGGEKWLDVGESRRDAVQVAQAVRAELVRTAYAGGVLVGGLDVVPADRLSVLDPELRRRVEEVNRRTGGGGDSDDFIVWNDDLYGDRDGEGKEEDSQSDRRAGATQGAGLGTDAGHRRGCPAADFRQEHRRTAPEVPG